MGAKKKRKGIYLPTNEQAISAGMELARLDRDWKIETPTGIMVKSVTMKFDGAEWLIVMRASQGYGGIGLVQFKRLENMTFVGAVLNEMRRSEWKTDKYG